MEKSNNKVEKIELCAIELLTACTDNYDSRVWEIIKSAVIPLALAMGI